VPVPWNHNIQYHDLLLRAVPSSCRDALDVGCGDGMFARRLAGRVGAVTGVDASKGMIDRAEAESVGVPNVRFIHGDFLQLPLAERGYDHVSSLAAVHHTADGTNQGPRSWMRR
jgi:ubiquinone/menaquinone biosynthesis C-methylase UbiE